MLKEQKYQSKYYKTLEGLRGLTMIKRFNIQLVFFKTGDIGVVWTLCACSMNQGHINCCLAFSLFNQASILANQYYVRSVRSVGLCLCAFYVSYLQADWIQLGLSYPNHCDRHRVVNVLPVVTGLSESNFMLWKSDAPSSVLTILLFSLTAPVHWSPGPLEDLTTYLHCWSCLFLVTGSSSLACPYAAPLNSCSCKVHWVLLSKSASHLRSTTNCSGNHLDQTLVSTKPQSHLMHLISTIDAPNQKLPPIFLLLLIELLKTFQTCP